LLPPSGTPEEAQADYLNKDNWRKRAELLKGYKGGFRAFKIDIHPSLGRATGSSFRPSPLGPLPRSRRSTRWLARPWAPITTSSSTATTSWMSPAHQVCPGNGGDQAPFLRRSPLSRILRVLDGRPAVLAHTHPDRRKPGAHRGVRPFIANQAVDCLQPDLVHAGGITGTKIVADFAASYRMPISLHNVQRLCSQYASQQFAASVFQLSADRVPALVRRGAGGGGQCSRGQERLHSAIDASGLGIVLDQGYLKANLAEGEPWWG